MKSIVSIIPLSFLLFSLSLSLTTHHEYEFGSLYGQAKKISKKSNKNNLTKKEKTRYKADKVTIKQKEKIVILLGNAFIRKGKQGLTADKIIWNQRTDTAEAFNNVKFLNQKQGVVYRGGYLIFYLGEDRVFAREKPYIENKKEKTLIYADTFTAYTKSNVIKAKKNTRIFMNQGETNEVIANSVDADYYVEKNDVHLFGKGVIYTSEQVLKAKTIILNQTNRTLTLIEDVRVTTIPENDRKNKQKTKPSKGKDDQKKGKYSSEDYILSCDHGIFRTDVNDLNCEGNARVTHTEKDQRITADILVYDQSNSLTTLYDNVHYYEHDGTNSYQSYSDWLQLREAETLIIQSNKVYSYQQNLDRSTNYTLNCNLLYFYYNSVEEPRPDGKHDLMECFGTQQTPGKLKNISDASEINSSQINYYTDRRYGRAENEPYFVNQDSSNPLYIYSRVIELFDQRKEVTFSDDVVIISRTANETQPIKTNSIINCLRAKYNYGATNEIEDFEPTFTCHDQVVISNEEQKLNLKGDLLTYYFEQDFSRMDGNVSFLKQNNETNYITGTSLYAINDHSNSNFNLYQDVETFEYENEVKISELRTDHLRYSYANSNQVEAFTNVDYYFIADRSHLYTDYFNYNSELRYGYSLGGSIMVQLASNQGKADDTIYYADRIEFYESQHKINMYENIYLFQYMLNGEMPPSSYNDLLHLNYMDCQEGSYNFKDEPYFECFESFHLKDHKEGTDVYSDYVIHDINQNYSIIKEDPMIERNLITNYYQIFSSNVEYDRDNKLIYFVNDVMMINLNEDKTTNSYMACDYSIYGYTTDNHQMECFTNVELKSIEDDIVLTSQYVKYDPETKYSYASQKPFLKKTEKGRITTIDAEIMERFEDKSVMYAKGNVLIDNGKDRAKSDWAIYNLETEKINLYGNPQVLDEKGSTFSSEEIVFDIIANTMQLGSGVQGNFLFDNFGQ